MCGMKLDATLLLRLASEDKGLIYERASTVRLSASEYIRRGALSLIEDGLREAVFVADVEIEQST